MKKKFGRELLQPSCLPVLGSLGNISTHNFPDKCMVKHSGKVSQPVSSLIYQISHYEHTKMMKAAVFMEKDTVEVIMKPIPVAGPGEAVIKVTLTTICGTDVHILKGEHVVRSGLTLGHEPVGVISELGLGVTGYKINDRVLVSAITPCGHCGACPHCDGKAVGGWRFGNTIDGCHAEYLLVPYAMGNLTLIPDDLSDEQVLMCCDIMSTGFGASEVGKVKIGDRVAVFGQGPVGMCATIGARLRGATQIFGVDCNPKRLAMAKELGADEVINFKEGDPVQLIMEATNGRGVDVAIGTKRFP